MVIILCSHVVPTMSKLVLLQLLSVPQNLYCIRLIRVWDIEINGFVRP